MTVNWEFKVKNLRDILHEEEKKIFLYDVQEWQLLFLYSILVNEYSIHLSFPFYFSL